MFTVEKLKCTKKDKAKINSSFQLCIQKDVLIVFSYIISS